MISGGSGNIGAGNLQLLAENLETAIKERETREKIDALNERLKKRLEPFIVQLEQKLPEDIGVMAVEIDLKKLKAVCDKLAVVMMPRHLMC